MSSLGEFLNAMVALREQKAKVAEYNASQQIAGMSSLGQGIGGLLGNLGKGMETQQQDLLANQLYNRQNPPRAVAVNQALQGPADIAAAQMPGGPLNAGGPFTGGVKGLAIQDMLDKSEMSRERLANQGTLNEARIANIGSTIDVRQSDLERRTAQLQLNQEREARLAREKQIDDERKQVSAAMSSYKLSSQKWKDDTGHITDYGNQMRVAMAAAAGAKDQASYDSAVQKITGTYMLGEKYGFKVAYPEIPQPAFMRQDTQSQLDTLQQTPLDKGMIYNWAHGIDPAATQKQIEALKSQKDYVPQLQPWNIPDVPERPELEQFVPPTPAQGPSAAAPAGGGGGGAIPTISLQEARKKNPNITPGLKTDKNGNQILIQ